MSKTWTHLRLRKSTHARLLEIQQRLERHRQLGHHDVAGREGQLTMDELVNLLIDRHEANRRRNSRGKKARRTRRQEELWVVRVEFADGAPC